MKQNEGFYPSDRSEMGQIVVFVQWDILRVFVQVDILRVFVQVDILRGRPFEGAPE